MRDAIIFILVFGSLPFIFKRPAIGVLVFTWLSLMNPHRLTYGPAFNFPFAAMIAGFTVLCLFISKEPKRLPMRPLTWTLLLFTVWMCVTSVFALEPLLVWREWDRVMKTLLMIFISMAALNTEKDLKRFVIVVALSLGIFGLKGGIFTVMSGGSFRVYGPSGSYIEENNSMALALVTVLPLIWYLRSLVKNKYLVAAVIATTAFSALAAMGSYSRGALVGGAIMLLYLALQSPKKLQTLAMVVVLGGLIAAVMPDQWFARMDTINDYKGDGSAMGRINAWKFAVNVASDNLLGGGFNVFSRRMFAIYAPNPDDYHVAHSIYFQVLGDHGYLGLALFLTVMLLTWRCGTRIIKRCKDNTELKWAVDLARMCQVSLIGYAVSGAFLSLAYFDLYYDIIVILVVLEKIITSKVPVLTSTPRRALTMRKQIAR